MTWSVLVSLDQLFRFSVPLFVFISGYTLYSKYRDNFMFLKFFLKRITKVMPWYVVWSLIIYMYINFTVLPGYVNYPIWKLIFLGKVDYHLYFVSMIFQLYLLFPLLLWIFKKLKIFFLIVLFLLEAALYYVFSLDGQGQIQLPWLFYEQQQYLFFGTWIFYFVLGFAIAEKQQSESKLGLRKLSLSKNQIIFALLTLVALIYTIHDSLFLISKTADTNVAPRSTRILLLFYSTSFIVTALVCSNLIDKMNSHLLKPLLYFAKISFLVYLIHSLVIRVLGNFILPNTIPNLVIFTILVFFLSIILAQISILVASKTPLKQIFQP